MSASELNIGIFHRELREKDLRRLGPALAGGRVCAHRRGAQDDACWPRSTPSGGSTTTSSEQGRATGRGLFGDGINRAWPKKAIARFTEIVRGDSALHVVDQRRGAGRAEVLQIGIIPAHRSKSLVYADLRDELLYCARTPLFGVDHARPPGPSCEHHFAGHYHSPNTELSHRAKLSQRLLTRRLQR